MLGKYIVRKVGKKRIAGKIVEVEVYIGPQDRASHAYKGKRTRRNEAEYLIGGHIYIYLVYGMYWQLNISTSGKDVPECILIRALEPAAKNAKLKTLNAEFNKIANGPGKLCNYLKLDKSFNMADVVKSDKIWLEAPSIRLGAGGEDRILKKDIVASARIGIDYAGRYWARRKWRFHLKNNSCVSKI